MKEYTAQSAKDAQNAGYEESYCDYLEHEARFLRGYYIGRSDSKKAQLMLSRSLGEALIGNNGI
jgi:hypothetical protein